MELKILILEHDPNDIELIQYELKKSSMVHMSKFVQTEQEFKDALLIMQPDVVLSDFNLPSFNGINAFNVKQSLYQRSLSLLCLVQLENNERLI